MKHIVAGLSLSAVAVPVALYVAYLCYFYLRHPFWARQHVPHYHMPATYLRNNVVLADASVLAGMNTRFMTGSSSAMVSAHVVDGLHQIPDAEADVGGFCGLVAGHYLRVPGARYTPPRAAIEALFVGHRAPCSLVVARDLARVGSGSALGAPTAAASTRPVFAAFRSKYPHHSPDDPSTAMQYVDFLTVDKECRRRGLSLKVIAHIIREWAERSVSRGAWTPTFLFKRENYPAPYRPFVSFGISLYEVDTDFLRETVRALAPAAHPVRRLAPADVGTLGELWASGRIQGLFTRVFHAGMENLYHQIREKQLAVFVMEDADGDPLAMYVFQNPHMDTGDDREADGRGVRSYTNLLCSASWGLDADGDGDKNEFAKGALRCLLSLVEGSENAVRETNVSNGGNREGDGNKKEDGNVAAIADGDSGREYRFPIGHLIVERVSHNGRVLPFFLSRDKSGRDAGEKPAPRAAKRLFTPEGEVDAAYYTYNYVCSKTAPEDCLFLF
jgi:hypothetical protein